jgi:hypothetical protein
LTGHGLFQPLDDDLPNGRHANAGRFQDPSGGGPILKQEMRFSATADDPSAAPFDTDAGPAQNFTHRGERAGTVFE